MKLTKSRQAATIFYVFFSIVFVVLGFWQINRGNEKTEIIEAFELQQAGQAIEFSSNSQKWERVYISGELDDKRIIYLDNVCLLYTSPSPRDRQKSRMPSSA